jgi:glycolate oxidase iron-sulfur subunit
LLDALGLKDSSSNFIDIFSACLLCGACSDICSRQIDISKELVAARSAFSSLAGPHAYEKYLARKLLDSPKRLAGLRVLAKTCGKVLGDKLPSGSGLRLRLALFHEDAFSVARDTPHLETALHGTPLTWFPGCSTRYLFPDIHSSCLSLLADSSFSLQYPDSLACCGLADWAAGDLEGARKNARTNIEAMETTEGPIMVSCASCYAHLKKYPEVFEEDSNWQKRAEKMASRVVEMSAFLEEKTPDHHQSVSKSEQKVRVFYHDPCHLRNGRENVDRARQQLIKRGGFTILELPDGPRCCGQGGLFHVAHPEISASIRDELVRDVLALQPDVVTSTCSGCLMQWQQGLAAAGSRVKVLHLAQLLEQE